MKYFPIFFCPQNVGLYNSSGLLINTNLREIFNFYRYKMSCVKDFTDIVDYCLSNKDNRELLTNVGTYLNEISFEIERDKVDISEVNAENKYPFTDLLEDNSYEIPQEVLDLIIDFIIKYKLVYDIATKLYEKIIAIIPEKGDINIKKMSIVDIRFLQNKIIESYSQDFPYKAWYYSRVFNELKLLSIIPVGISDIDYEQHADICRDQKDLYNYTHKYDRVINQCLRLGKIDTRTEQYCINIMNVINEVPACDSLILYRGIFGLSLVDEYKDRNYTDGSFKSKTASLEQAIRFSNQGSNSAKDTNGIFMFTYPNNLKRIVDDNEIDIESSKNLCIRSISHFPQEQEFIASPGENF